MPANRNTQYAWSSGNLTLLNEWPYEDVVLYKVIHRDRVCINWIKIYESTVEEWLTGDMGN